MPIRPVLLALAGALALAGCGQRGALESPVATPVEARPLPPNPQPVTAQWPETVDGQGRPVEPRARPRRATGTILDNGSFVLDPLL